MASEYSDILVSGYSGAKERGSHYGKKALGI